MNSQDSIVVANLGKKYNIRHRDEPRRYTALRDVLTENVKRLFRPARRHKIHPISEEFWALKDVSFQVKEGEVVGLIGRNGAGKSTLLKIISRITEPTTGKITLRGRVSSLLEVGTGFHPELTGRENIFLNGAILGMSKAMITAKFDQIVAFADVEKFLDTPVKRYSSGMYVRLAFAVAAHVEPEILIVDEVLAVGDAQFQKKCLGKMGEVARGGRTVLFVSHNMGVMTHLCQTGILMESGRVTKTGAMSEVIQSYLAAAANGQSNRFVARPADGEFIVRVLEAETVNERQIAAAEFGHEDSIQLKLLCAMNCPDAEKLASIRITVCLVDGMGRRIFTDQSKIPRTLKHDRLFSATMAIPSGLLTPGRYTFIVNVNIPPSEFLHRIEEVCPFTVTDLGSEFAVYQNADLGCVFAKCDWEITPLRSWSHSTIESPTTLASIDS